MKVNVGVTIDAPPARVWQYVEQLERHVEWMDDAVAIRFAGPTTRGAGTTFDCVTKVGPFRLTDRMRVVEWTPERAIGIEHRGIVTGRGRFRLRARRGGTRTHFRWIEQLTFPWWLGGPVTALVASPVLRSIWRRNLRNLKLIVEMAG